MMPDAHDNDQIFVTTVADDVAPGAEFHHQLPEAGFQLPGAAFVGEFDKCFGCFNQGVYSAERSVRAMLIYECVEPLKIMPGIG